MTSFSVDLSAKDRTSGRFMLRSLRGLAKAAFVQMKRHKISQTKVAEELGVDKAVISRILKGGANPTLRTIGEVAWALRLRPELTFHPIEQDGHNREPIRVHLDPPAIKPAPRLQNEAQESSLRLTATTSAAPSRAQFQQVRVPA